MMAGFDPQIVDRHDRKSSVTNRSGTTAYFLRNYPGADISCSI
jgi:hypothetical protein